MPYQLVPDAISHDTVRALEELLAEAHSGHVVGLAFVAMYRERRFIANTAGEAYRSPHFTRGMLLALDDKIALQIAESPT